jgi:hypothetical protein
MFRVKFEGAQDLVDHWMAAPVLHTSYFFAPNPAPGGPLRWLVVGFAPGNEPAEPWPGQVEYALADSSLVDFRDEQPIGGVAIYREVEPA